MSDEKPNIEPRGKAPKGTIKISNVVLGILILVIAVLSTIIYYLYDFSIKKSSKEGQIEIPQNTAGFDMPKFQKKQPAAPEPPKPEIPKPPAPAPEKPPAPKPDVPPLPEKDEVLKLPEENKSPEFLPDIFKQFAKKDDEIPPDPLVLPDEPDDLSGLADLPVPDLALGKTDKELEAEKKRAEAIAKEKALLERQLKSSLTAGGAGNTDLAVRENKTKLGSLLDTDKQVDVKATKYADLSTVLVKGTFIPCVLDTRINSDQLGFVRCTLSRDVFSADLTRVLLPKGTTLKGESRAQLKVGQERLFVLFNEFITPDGITADLASPGAGPLGQSGIGGKVDKHWLERFSSAVLIGLMADFIDNKTNSDNNNNNTNENTQDALSQTVTTIIEQYSKIPPTLTKNQGDIISIIVARDVDFSSLVTAYGN